MAEGHAEQTTMCYKVAFFFAVGIFCACTSLGAQSQWGRGLIVHSISRHGPGDFPKIPLYKNSDGTVKIDNIQFDGIGYSSDRFYEGRIFGTIELECETPNILFIDESEMCISVFVEKKEMIAWFRKEDLHEIGWKFAYYMDLLMQKRDTLDYSPNCYALTSLNLREGPGVNFAATCMLRPLVKQENEAVFEIQSLGTRSGAWLRVRVYKYNQSSCLDTMTETVLLKTFEGWVKAIDEETGRPNIWFKSCCEF